MIERLNSALSWKSNLQAGVVVSTGLRDACTGPLGASWQRNNAKLAATSFRAAPPVRLLMSSHRLQVEKFLSWRGGKPRRMRATPSR